MRTSRSSNNAKFQVTRHIHHRNNVTGSVPTVSSPHYKSPRLAYKVTQLSTNLKAFSVVGIEADYAESIRTLVGKNSFLNSRVKVLLPLQTNFVSLIFIEQWNLPNSLLKTFLRKLSKYEKIRAKTLSKTKRLT